MTITESILEYIKHNPKATNGTIAEALNTTKGSVAQQKLILRKRGLLPAHGEHTGLQQECEDVGIPINSVGNYWYKGKHYSIHSKPGGMSYFDLQDEIIGNMKKAAPKYPAIRYRKEKEGYLLVIDPADLHLNKLCSAYETGDEYNTRIAEQRVLEGVQGVLNKVRGFKIDQILFISGNDKLHVDTPRNTTTSGTPQDTHLMWYDAYRFAVDIERKIIELLLPLAPVHYLYNPSNHDYTNGFFMAQTIEAWFSKCKYITFDVSIAHRKYYRYGNNLIASTMQKN